MTSLVLSRIFPPRVGGSGRWMWELYRRLPPSEYVLAVGKHPRHSEFDRSHALRLVRMPLDLRDDDYFNFRGLANCMSAWRGLGGLGRNVGAHATHAASALPEGWLALLLKLSHGWPYLCYAHGEEVTLAGNGRMSSRGLRWMTRAVLKGANLVIANSRNTAEILRKDWHLSEHRVRLLHPGVDTGVFVPGARGAAERAQLGWDNRTVILTVARLERRKGHERLMRALPAIRAAVPNVLWSIVGDGEERSGLEHLAHQQGIDHIVEFRGEVDDRELVDCYQRSDLFVLPNVAFGGRIEGFGMAILEAQACGTPVVAGASGGTAEAMNCPTTGRLVKSDDSAELAETVIDLLADPGHLERMRAAARTWVEQRFDWNLLLPQAQRLWAAFL